ncbi:Hsp20/alpha crystallin family protein [Rufibacter quisquiliarum]|uniref:HSP20 family molecular chaperone IbpA n=1 Tax=Rufibacter quisquiliarum TaxID=1549639 RepID=A0A839GIG7_9BACT|nr:Hsp20/alpha crystallin family protein [Rufibacter quisquiliarum]MBA9078420.1 HSP20 family molecular chaperone IbpA [Rufibacter quisquiliarum]
MKLIKDKKFLQNIAHYIDLTNTLGGGVSQPQLRIDKLKKGLVLRVTLPGIDLSQCQVLLDKNQLTLMALHQSELNPAMQIPLFQHQVTLPPFVDFGQVTVVHEDHELQVRVPYLPQGPRLLEIEQR